MKVLVVVDMQKDFVSGALGSKEAEEIVPKVVEKINHFDGKIAVTFDTHHADYLQTQEGKNLPILHCVNGTDGWNLDERVFKALDVKERGQCEVCSFMKSTFGSTAMADWISHLHLIEEIDEVVLVGLCTDICVISNALIIKAFLPEVKVTVDAACCAGVTPESHNNALAAMKICQINIENWEG